MGCGKLQCYNSKAAWFANLAKLQGLRDGPKLPGRVCTIDTLAKEGNGRWHHHIIISDLEHGRAEDVNAHARPEDGIMRLLGCTFEPRLSVCAIGIECGKVLARDGAPVLADEPRHGAKVAWRIS